MALGRPLRLVHIRERRPRPGLQPQHLTVVRALAAISGARVEGDALDSTAVTFLPFADQLVPFLGFAGEPSEFTCPVLSSHLETVAWVLEQFVPGRVRLDAGPPARVRVTPAGDSR